MSIGKMNTLPEVKAKRQALLDIRRPNDVDFLQLAKHFLPRKSRYLDGKTERGKGLLRGNTLHGIGVRSRRTASAGLHGGMTSPARPWFQITVEDQDLAKTRPVSAWLSETQRRMQVVLARSNFYQAIHSFYDELLTFGTDFMFINKDLKMGLRFDTLTAGEFCLDIDERGMVDTVFREMEMSARNIVRQFGIEKVSDQVKLAYSKAESMFNTFKVIHAVFPREDRDPKKLTATHMPFASYYYESVQKSAFLDHSGYKSLPGVGARWDVAGGEVYGSAPSMDTIDDVRMFQSIWRTYLKQEHKRADPPVVGPPDVKRNAHVPGSYTEVAGVGDQAQAYALYNVKPDPRGMVHIMQEVKEGIREGMYNDLFKMLAMSAGYQRTATEVAEMHEEKLLQLGPVTERLHAEAFTPTIDLTFEHMLDMDMIPPWPEELSEMPLKVEFISILAQAQKMVATGAVDRFCGFIDAHISTLPELADVPAVDNMANDYAEALGLSAKVLNSQKERDAIREQRNEAAAGEQQAAMAAQGANVAKTLGDTPVGEDRSALEALAEGAA